jgi:hypothetical protein
MIENMEHILAKRLKQIDLEIKRLKDEKIKTKQALDLFVNSTGLIVTSVNANTGESVSYNEPIFKDKIRTILSEQYPTGANSRQILEVINKNWTRQVKRSSLSPQLSRLKDDGIIELKDNVWKLIAQTEKKTASEEAVGEDAEDVLS